MHCCHSLSTLDLLTSFSIVLTLSKTLNALLAGDVRTIKWKIAKFNNAGNLRRSRNKAKKSCVSSTQFPISAAGFICTELCSVSFSGAATSQS